jgi:hypothetical protein
VIVAAAILAAVTAKSVILIVVTALVASSVDVILPGVMVKTPLGLAEIVKKLV